MTAGGRHHLHFNIESYCLNKKILVESSRLFHRSNLPVLIETKGEQFILDTLQFFIPVKRVKFESQAEIMHKILKINIQHSQSTFQEYGKVWHNFVMCAQHQIDSNY